MTDTFTVWVTPVHGERYADPDAFKCGPNLAVQRAKAITESVGAKMGMCKRVVIIDSGDCINFDWNDVDGVVYPKPEDLA